MNCFFSLKWNLIVNKYTSKGKPKSDHILEDCLVLGTQTWPVPQGTRSQTLGAGAYLGYSSLPEAWTNCCTTIRTLVTVFSFAYMLRNLEFTVSQGENWWSVLPYAKMKYAFLEYLLQNHKSWIFSTYQPFRELKIDVHQFPLYILYLPCCWILATSCFSRTVSCPLMNLVTDLWAPFCLYTVHPKMWTDWQSIRTSFFAIPKVLYEQVSMDSIQWVLCAKSCSTLCSPIGYSPPGCSVYRIILARILEWVAISTSRRSLPPGDLPDPGIEPVSLASPALTGGFFTTNATWEVPKVLWTLPNMLLGILHDQLSNYNWYS